MYFLKRGLTFLIVVLPIVLFSQNGLRKGKFYFNIGPEYRVTPTYKQNNYSTLVLYTNPDLQNSGLAINIGVDYYFTNNLSLGFKNSFRYDLITSQIEAAVPIEQGVSNTKKDLLFGYHFNLNYHFQIFQKGDLLFSAGVSLLNRNSEFTEIKSIYDNDGQVIGSVSSLNSFKYSANKISAGYGRGRSKVMVGIYITGNSGYFAEQTTFIVPFLNYTYDFASL